MILDDKGLPEMMMVLHHNWDKGEVMISFLKCEGWIVGAALSWDPSQTVFCDLWDSEDRLKTGMSLRYHSVPILDGQRKSSWHRILVFFGTGFLSKSPPPYLEITYTTF